MINRKTQTLELIPTRWFGSSRRRHGTFQWHHRNKTIYLLLMYSFLWLIRHSDPGLARKLTRAPGGSSIDQQQQDHEGSAEPRHGQRFPGWSAAATRWEPTSSWTHVNFYFFCSGSTFFIRLMVKTPQVAGNSRANHGAPQCVLCVSVFFSDWPAHALQSITPGWRQRRWGGSRRGP